MIVSMHQFQEALRDAAGQSTLRAAAPDWATAFVEVPMVLVTVCEFAQTVKALGWENLPTLACAPGAEDIAASAYKRAVELIRCGYTETVEEKG